MSCNEKNESCKKTKVVNSIKSSGYEEKIDVFFDENFLKRKVTKEKESDVLTKKEKYKKENLQKKFVPPTQEEVRNYALSVREEKKITVDDCELYSLQFWLWYDAVNWFVGKKKMVSWHSAFSGWILRNQNFRNKPPRGGGNVAKPLKSNPEDLAKENENYFETKKRI
jgi:hypothetical protein